MRKKLLFGLLCLLSVTTFVNAEENNKNVAPWNTILKNGVIHLEGTKPTEENTEKAKVQVQQQINEQYKKEIESASTKHQGEDHIIVERYYDTLVELKYVSCEFEGKCDFVAVNVPITWDDEEYSEIFQKIAPNGIMTINAIKPSNSAGAPEIEDYSYLYIEKILGNQASGFLSGCNDDYSECGLSLSINENDKYINESHVVKVVWQEEDPAIKKIVDGYIDKISSFQDDFGNNRFIVTDLNLINYYNHTKSDLNFINASSLKQILDNNHLTYSYVGRAGDNTPMAGVSGGCLVLYYDDIAYGDVIVWIEERAVIYIPEETENTSDAYIAAAKKRIDAYLGNSNTKVEVGGKRDELASNFDFDSEFDFSIFGDESKMGDYYYLMTINGNQYPFLIMRDSSRIETPVVETTDVKTNISVSTDSAEVPFDTVLKVEEVTKESLFFKGVAKELLKIKDEEEVQIYDFTLFSESLNQNITKLDSGEFKVSVPVKESLRGKKLVAYYITEDNKVEEHPVTEKDGIATFTTNHFSVYTIAEARGIENGVVVSVPKTYDGIMNSIVLGVVGLTGLATAIVVMKKREN